MLSIHPCGTSIVLLHAVKSYDVGPSCCDGVLWIFIALKFHRLGLFLNPQPLGPVVSTLTTTPPRRLL
jgi:hypothetical protein